MTFLGKARIVVGKAPNFVGKAQIFVGNAQIFLGKAQIFLGKAQIFVGKSRRFVPRRDIVCSCSVCIAAPAFPFHQEFGKTGTVVEQPNQKLGHVLLSSSL